MNMNENFTGSPEIAREADMAMRQRNLEQKHSQEPWHESGGKVYDALCDLVVTDVGADDAARIIACVNACRRFADPEAIIDELLATQFNADKAAASIALLREQRDELLLRLRTAAGIAGVAAIIWGSENEEILATLAKYKEQV